jgi:hypothetical protein
MTLIRDDLQRSYSQLGKLFGRAAKPCWLEWIDTEDLALGL